MHLAARSSEAATDSKLPTVNAARSSEAATDSKGASYSVNPFFTHGPQVLAIASCRGWGEDIFIFFD